ncbi:TetR family transcriptional regulator [Nocardia crassostreae]|uniref:TetR family transcriptional regulator n=1 Tax=Nocardia crassostreae TaxID=53428 RepID=UPI00082C3545|nr:TetR family transcriptional regulator [Nocardia crassostreae]
MTDDPRSRILRTALDLFAERGYHSVSVREIAEGVRLTKTAVLYHFPSKSDIVSALVEPLLAGSETVVESARQAPDAEARCWAVIEGLVDVWLAHRKLMRMQMHGHILATNPATFARMRDIGLGAQELIAGPDPDLAAQVRAAQIFAALSDPVMIYADQPIAQLRAAILDGAALLLGWTRLRADTATRDQPRETPARPSGRGRPNAMSAAMVESARRMRDSGDYTVDRIAAELGVSRATVYRHLTASAE